MKYVYHSLLQKRVKFEASMCAHENKPAVNPIKDLRRPHSTFNLPISKHVEYLTKKIYFQNNNLYFLTIFKQNRFINYLIICFDHSLYLLSILFQYVRKINLFQINNIFRTYKIIYISREKRDNMCVCVYMYVFILRL